MDGRFQRVFRSILSSCVWPYERSDLIRLPDLTRDCNQQGCAQEQYERAAGPRSL